MSSGVCSALTVEEVSSSMGSVFSNSHKVSLHVSNGWGQIHLLFSRYLKTDALRIWHVLTGKEKEKE